jgi:hypothetical protein
MQKGIQLPELLARIKVLREARLRAEHVAFSFMKRRVQPLMARDTLGFKYTGRRRHVVDAWRRSQRRRHCRQAGTDLQGHATVHGVPRPGVLRRAPAEGGK